MTEEKSTPADPSETAKATAPVKPAPSSKQTATLSAEMTRRGLFSWAAVAWVAFSAAIGGCMTAFGRFMFPNVLFEPPTSFKVGFPDDFPPGGRRRAFQGGQRGLDRQSRRSADGADRDLHPSWLPSCMARGAEQVQVPLPRKWLLQDRHQFRGPDTAAARTGSDLDRSGRWPDSGRQGAKVSLGAGPVGGFQLLPASELSGAKCSN